MDYLTNSRTLKTQVRKGAEVGVASHRPTTHPPFRGWGCGWDARTCKSEVRNTLPSTNIAPASAIRRTPMLPSHVVPHDGAAGRVGSFQTAKRLGRALPDRSPATAPIFKCAVRGTHPINDRKVTT
jgi:hypothetical protein